MESKITTLLPTCLAFGFQSEVEVLWRRAALLTYFALPWIRYFILRVCVKRISHPVFYGALAYKQRRMKGTEIPFITSGLNIAKRLRRRQYDPLIIERTIGLVLGPYKALYRPFLKHWTLTNKALRTIYDGPCPKRPQGRQQGPAPRPQFNE